MPAHLRDELKQKKPFSTLEEEASLNILRTNVVLEDSMEQLLKPHGITPTQYNVLRILRGAGTAGLCRNEVRDRLLTRMPDATRLLDRMEEAGLVTRSRDGDDRRLVATRLTAEGRRLVNALDDDVVQEHQRRLGHLTTPQLRTLIDLLEYARSPP